MKYTKEEIYKLHQKHSAGEFTERYLELVWNHCNIVAEIALQFVDKLIAEGMEVNKDLVISGALIHDVGVYDCYDENLNKHKVEKYICHGTLGMQYVLDEGYDNKLARFCGYHTGVGITEEDIEKANLPLKNQNYIPVTLEEEIVAYADKFHTKWPKFVSFEEALEGLSEFGVDKVIILERFKMKFGVPDFSPLEEKYGKWQKEFDEYLNSISKQ